MVDDKYIGLALALSGSVAIGTSFIITKKGLNDAGDRGNYANGAGESFAYLKSPIWWAGISTIANFAAYTFAPPILITPLGAGSVIVGAVLASFLLGEELGHIGRVGCTLCLLGSLVIVLHAPEDKDIQTVDEILHLSVQPGFMLYCFTVLVFCLVMIYSVAPKYGRSNPLVYISICSLAGSVSIMAVKGLGIAIKLTFAGNNQLGHPSTYVFALVSAGCIVVQMNYFNKALDLFSTNVVNPLYYVGFSTATIVASVILFQGFNTTDPVNSISLLAGFAITFLGVHLLEISRKPAGMHGANGHSALEGGLMNPRLSLTGRMSIDGWNGVGNTPIGGISAPTSGHVRRGSGRQSTTLFNALEEDDDIDAVVLERLAEADEEDELEADERTHLHSDRHARSGSRSGSNSPRGVVGDPRRTPR
ncbi:magnesium transporter NIPA-domain-containing protein [Cytidiella melzeri]|nr:magnesium transporter NIPA-domain-containing protein [Cytidiella melzeri]